MDAGDTLLRHHRERRWLALALLLLAALLGGERLAAHRDIEHGARLRLAAQARTVEDNLVHQLRATRAALQGLAAEAGVDATAADRGLATARLALLVDTMPGVRTLQWLDVSGRVRASNRPELLGRSFADSDYVRNVQSRPDARQLYVSSPFRTVLNVYSLNLSMAVVGADGTLRGIVAATLDPSYFETVLHSVLYTPDMFAALAHAGGVALLFSPAGTAPAGTVLDRPGSMFQRHRDSGEAATVLDGLVAATGEHRLIAQRTVSPPGLRMDRALVLAVSRSWDALFTPWRQQAGLMGLLWLLLAGGSGVALLSQQRRQREVLRLAQARQRERAVEAERLALALAGADLGLWDLDLRRQVCTFDARWRSMLGEPAQAATEPNSAWSQRLHPDDREGVLARQQAALDGRTPGYEATYRLRHAAGHWVWVLARGRVVERGADGSPLRMVGTHMDVSDRMQAEQTLRDSEQSLAITLHCIGDAVIATDPQGRVTRLNATAERLTGWTVPEAVGRPLGEVFRICSAQTREPVVDPVAVVLARGQIVGLANDTVLMARGGREYQIADSAAPIRDASGRVVGVVLVFSDVTEQYRTLQALRDRERQLSAITQALPGPVSRVDREGRYLFANRQYEAWFGFAPGAVVGRTQLEVLGPERLERVSRHLQRAMDGETVRYETPVDTASDGRRHALVTLVPDLDAQGRPAGHFTIVADITERKQAEDALRQREQATRGLLNALRSGVVVHGPDTRIIDSNASASRILGLSQAQMEGRQAIDPAWRFIEEDGSPMPLARYPVNQVLAARQLLSNMVLGILRPDRDQPTWVLVNAFPVLGPDGELQQAVVTFADITERQRAEEALRASEARLRMASRMARLGGWRIELPSQRLALAAEAAQMLGLPEGGTPALADWLEHVRDADRERLHGHLRRCMDSGEPMDQEIDLERSDGTRLHLRVLGERVCDPAGKVLALQGALQDLSEQHRAAQQLQLLQASIERLNDVVLITEADELDEPGPRIVFVNSAFERLTGWRREEVLGRSPRFLQGPDTDVLELRRIGQALYEDQSVRAEIVNYRRDGTPYWIELEIVPLRTQGAQGGATTHFVAVERDITDRKRAEAEVRAVQQELAVTLDAVPDLLFDVDLQGRVHGHHSPRKELLYVPSETFIGRRMDEFLPAEAASVIAAALREAHAHGFSDGLQYELPLPDGVHWFELSVAHKHTLPGELPRFIVLARDITDRKQAEVERRGLERQLREAQKMESINTLAAGIAHDFNNILPAILGNVALARGDLAEGHPALASLDQIEKSSLRARSLVQQILAFSRGRPQQQEVQRLQPVVDETLALLGATIPPAVRIERRVPEAAVQVRGDATQLQQVLMNLCINAWQALPQGRGRIEVGVEALARGAPGLPPLPQPARAGVAHLWVRDDGSGMDAATRDRIFDPFFTTKPVGQGTGLGLAVVHGIVRGHLGAITVESAPGAGSCFHVWLPLAEDAAAAIGHARPPAAGPAGSGQHVLYVDDDEVMTVLVQRLLQRAGFRVTVCADARQALALMRSEGAGVDVLVSDFNMPELSGLDLAEQVQALRPGLPIIISSGYITQEISQRADRVGVRALMKKENTLEELASLVQRMLAPAAA